MHNMMVIRLSILMFFQFFIWGAWYTTIAVFMSSHDMENLTHWPYTINPVAAIVSPFFLGLIADRYFATERVLAILHLLGGTVMLVVPLFVNSPTIFISLLLVYNLFYMPTLGLANSLVFHNIQSQEKQFPYIRVFGTVGWIAAGLFISFVLAVFTASVPEKTALPLYLAAFAGIVLGIYCFTLPHTPPTNEGKIYLSDIVGLSSLRQLGTPSFYIFIVCSLLICIPLAAYYNFTQIFLIDSGFTNIAGTQSLGQVSEVVFMLFIPLFFMRLGVKRMLLLGMAAWVLRYALFALGAPDATQWMMLAGIVLHGICYDFFFVTGQIYVDKKSNPAIRGQAQRFLVFITYGVGMLIGAQLAGNYYNHLLGEASVLSPDQWTNFWMVPAIFAAMVLIIFHFSFQEASDRDTGTH
jgi:nucleoside transporter